MADSHFSSSTEKYKKIASSFFTSPRLLFTPKISHEAETMMSPTSILDSKPFSAALKNPFWDKLESKGVGLVGIVDEKKHDEVNSNKQDTRMVLFGSQLKIQIPPLSLPPPAADFGIKKGNSHLASSSSDNCNSSLQVRVLSVSEMELSEDYTRVIYHGPNPRTTHIFDNCIIETSSFDIGCSASDSDKESGYFSHPTATTISYPSQSFLSFCFYCNKNLGQGQDIYMYRGERAFCSKECRYQGMLLEEGMTKLEDDDVFGT